MADQNITALPIATTPESSDQLLLVGATEEKLIDYDKLADAILGKIASKNFTLDQGNKTLLAALNELNSNSFASKTNSFHARGIQNIGEKNIITIRSDTNEQCYFIMLAGVAEKYCITLVNGIESNSKVNHIDLLNKGVTFSGSSVNHTIIIDSGNWSRGVIYSYRPFTVEIA